MALEPLIITPDCNKDVRRRITDITPQVKLLEVHTPYSLGRHYHQQMEELFYVVQGRIHITLEDPATKERIEYEVLPGQSTIMRVNIAHLVNPDLGTKFIEVKTPKFMPEDTHPYKF